MLFVKKLKSISYLGRLLGVEGGGIIYSFRRGFRLTLNTLAVKRAESVKGAAPEDDHTGKEERVKESSPFQPPGNPPLGVGMFLPPSPSVSNGETILIYQPVPHRLPAKVSPSRSNFSSSPFPPHPLCFPFTEPSHPHLPLSPIVPRVNTHSL